MSGWLVHLSGCQTRYWQQLGVAFSYPESTAAVYFLFAIFLLEFLCSCFYYDPGIVMFASTSKGCVREKSGELYWIIFGNKFVHILK